MGEIVESLVSEAALDRLFQDTLAAEATARAQRLGEAVWRCLDLLNENPFMQHHSSYRNEDEVSISSDEYQVGRRRAALLEFVVPSEFEEQEETSEWLPNMQQVELNLRGYDLDLPKSREDWPDESARSTIIVLAPAPEYDDPPASSPRNRLYAANYKNGSQLDPQDIDSVIGVLTMIANQAAIEQPTKSTRGAHDR